MLHHSQPPHWTFTPPCKHDTFQEVFTPKHWVIPYLTRGTAVIGGSPKHDAKMWRQGNEPIWAIPHEALHADSTTISTMLSYHRTIRTIMTIIYKRTIYFRTYHVNIAMWHSDIKATTVSFYIHVYCSIKISNSQQHKGPQSHHYITSKITIGL